MRFSTRGLGAMLATSMVISTACNVSSLLAPSGVTEESYRATGEVRDDDCLLPDALSAESCLPVTGARVEVMDGPEKGRVAITGPDGKYDLGLLTEKPLVCFIINCSREPTGLSVSKNGWATTSASTYSSSPQTIHLGQAPHVLWGLVELPGGPSEHVPAAGVRVVIIGGPNAGRVAFSNDAGVCRFDNLPTQGPFSLEFSKEGFRTEQRSQSSLEKNRKFSVRLTTQ